MIALCTFVNVSWYKANYYNLQIPIRHDISWRVLLKVGKRYILN